MVKSAFRKEKRNIKKSLHKNKISSNIFIAFVLNLVFSVFEFVGGAISGSVAIMSDAVHDLGDAISIGLSYYLERKSHKGPDTKYTYGYSRFSVLGGFVTTLVLVVGAAFMIYLSITRLFDPTPVKSGWMIILAVIGVVVNGMAAFRTRSGKTSVRKSINQRSVNLHMLEDVYNWILVLASAIVLAFTGWAWLDSVVSIFVAVYLIASSFDNFRDILTVFLEKVPNGTSVEVVRYQILAIPHVKGVHHIHLWSMDEKNLYATMHVVVDGAVVDGVVLKGSVSNPQNIKEEIRKAMRLSGISHVTIELETENEVCKEH